MRESIGGGRRRSDEEVFLAGKLDECSGCLAEEEPEPTSRDSG
jgi:hypothetical protein